MQVFAQNNFIAPTLKTRGPVRAPWILRHIQSIPLHETRDFVQRVLTNYWIYQLRLGQPTPSLDQIASHDWPRYIAQDGTR